jgi:lipopolysaccharide/colanic/teichoic acid biosynthesis glycosyltransferase
MEHNIHLQLSIGASGKKSFYYSVKRLMDLIFAIVALLILSPVFLIISILIKLDSSGPIIFSQKRLGAQYQIKDNQPSWQLKAFTFYKFRTMQIYNDPHIHNKYMEAYIAGDESKLKELQVDTDKSGAFKLHNDPRVTGLGKHFRKWSLDELPQIWNVIRGDMSLVGPRPPIMYEVEMYAPEHYSRMGATPGITGLWQVCGRTTTTFEEMVHLDLEYIERQSIWMDLRIILLTIPTVLSTKGAG